REANALNLALAVYPGPARFEATFAADPAVKADAPTTITVVTAQLANAWPTRPAVVWSGAIAAATAPPAHAATTPETDHQTKAMYPAAAGAALAVGISTERRPAPKPSITRRICTTREVNTPAITADHVHLRIGIIAGGVVAMLWP